MKKDSSNFWSHLSAALFVLAIIVCVGASSIMFLRRSCVLEGKRVQFAEQKISTLKRENDFWNAEIANSKNPSKLRLRIGENFVLPHGERIVFAFPLKDIPVEQRHLVVFKSNSKAPKTAKTAKR